MPPERGPFRFRFLVRMPWVILSHPPAPATSLAVKIASWNINSVRFRAAIVEQFLKEAAPDILCLQETKVVDDDFPFALFRSLGYEHIIIHGQRMHHGVAIVSKVPITEDDRLDWQANAEARHVGIRLPNGVRLENVYIPAGGDVAQARFWTGLRPMTPDGTPIVGATRLANLYTNTGHGTLGWTMACGSGRLLADLVSSRTPEIAADDLAVGRYRRAA